MTPIALTDTLLENTTGQYSFTLVDSTGAGVDGIYLQSLTVTLHDRDSHQIVNGRDHQNILNANGGTVTTDQGPPLVTTVVFELQPADTAIFNQLRWVEYRVMTFQWVWDSGMRHEAHAVQFGVEALEFVP